jgi:hypothetical protein
MQAKMGVNLGFPFPPLTNLPWPTPPSLFPSIISLSKAKEEVEEAAATAKKEEEAEESYCFLSNFAGGA